MKTKILYIEDELFLGKIVKETLEKNGYEVHWETNGAKVMDRFHAVEPDVCVVDIMLPNVDGYALCEQIRAAQATLPIIFLTAKGETTDLVKGFEAGGTEYMRKPFSMEELVVRIENQLKLLNGRNHAQEKVDGQVEIGKYTLNTDRYELLTPTKTIKLSQREMQVLEFLVKARNGTLDRKQLLMEIWGDDSFFNSRNLDVYIRKIRAYFCEDANIQIKTLKGKGYLFITE
jgi:DNA-binding response OmpR family regulator